MLISPVAQRPHYAIRVLPEAVNVFAREANASFSSWEEDATGSYRGGVAGHCPPDGVGSEDPSGVFPLLFISLYSATNVCVCLHDLLCLSTCCLSHLGSYFFP